MLSLVIGLLTLVLVLNSLLLILMVLVQLPKKEAGLGMAFGGATADALFGAGSGTVLTRWTKYATGLFLALSLFLSVLRNHEHRASGKYIADQLSRQTQAASALAATNTGAMSPSIALPTFTNTAPATTTNPTATATLGEPTLAPAANPTDSLIPPLGTDPAPAPPETP